MFQGLTRRGSFVCYSLELGSPAGRAAASEASLQRLSYLQSHPLCEWDFLFCHQGSWALEGSRSGYKPDQGLKGVSEGQPAGTLLSRMGIKSNGRNICRMGTM